jgi:hypothetical protein
LVSELSDFGELKDLALAPSLHLQLGVQGVGLAHRDLFYLRRQQTLQLLTFVGKGPP